MHGAIVAVILASALLLAEGTVALADDPAPIVTVEDSSSVAIRGEDRAPGKPVGSPLRRVALNAAPSWSFWIYSFVDGEFCRQRRTTRVAAVAEQLRPYATYSMALPVCARPAPGEPPPSTDDVARSFWDIRVLPSPTLKVVPDYAITGKPVYLQIGGPKDQRFDVDNPIGDDVAITAGSTYLVDWGDGTRTTTASQGGPWPSGDVTHTYVDMAPGRTITVRQVWTAGWTAGPNGGDLADLQTTDTLVVPVTQLQAVRNR